MNPGAKVVRALRDAWPALDLLKDDYCILGSAALALAGVDVGEVGDIDVLTSDAGDRLLQRVWHARRMDLQPRPSSRRFRSSSLCHYAFGSVVVETMVDLEVLSGGGWHSLSPRRAVRAMCGAQVLRVSSLEDQRRALRLAGRAKDRERLRRLEQSPRASKQDGG